MIGIERNTHTETAERASPAGPFRPAWSYAATSTLIDRGLASSRSGSRTVRTPCL